MISSTLFLFFWVVIIIIIAVIVIIYWTETGRPEPVDRVFFGGPIITMTSAQESTINRPEAIGIRGDNIAVVGNRNYIETFIGPDTIITDLQGRSLLPGFIDCGSLFPFQGFFTNFYVDVSPFPFETPGINTLNGILAAIQQQVDDVSGAADAGSAGAGDWVVGAGYDPNFVEGGLLTRQDLDSISTTTPIWVLYRDGYSGVANSLALSIAGISETSGIPTGSQIFLDIGLLQGQIVEFVNRLVPLPTVQENITAAKIAAAKYTATGITTVLNGETNQLIAQFLNAMARLNDIPNRIILYPDVETTERILAGIFNPEPIANRVFVRATNMTVDGSLQYYTAYLKEKYLTTPGFLDTTTDITSPSTCEKCYKKCQHEQKNCSCHRQGTTNQGITSNQEAINQGTSQDAFTQNTIDPNNYKGFLGTDPEAFRSQFFELHQDGLQIAVSATGSAALQFVIDTIAQAQLIFPRPDANHIILNALELSRLQILELKNLSVILSFFTPALYYWGDLYASTYLGLERTRELALIQFAIDNQIKFTLHGNTPETPINIPLMLWSATSRQGLNGDVYGQGQTITSFQALEAVTKTASESNGISDIVGTIQEGKFADLVILDKNPLDIHPTLLRTLTIEETIINGEIVFKRNNTAKNNGNNNGNNNDNDINDNNSRNDDKMSNKIITI